MQINACIYGSTYENYVISLVASLFELTITISFVQYALDKKKMSKIGTVKLKEFYKITTF